MVMLSKSQIRKRNLAMREALWACYITLLRFPVEMRPAFISVLDNARLQLSINIGIDEEKLYEEAEKVVEQLGRLDLMNGEVKNVK